MIPTFPTDGMIDQVAARKIAQDKLGKNLVIVDEFEGPNTWCFELGVVNDDGEVMPILGNSTIRISKEDGEMVD